MVEKLERPSDFDGELMNPMSEMKHCNISDMASFVLSYQSFVLPESLTAEETICWNLLCEAVQHYIDAKPSSLGDKEAFEEDSAAACAALWEYAEMAQKAFGTRLCTPNLHKMLCVALRQESLRGPLAKDKELWIERMVQWLKQLAHGRAANHPLMTMAKDTMHLM